MFRDRLSGGSVCATALFSETFYIPLYCIRYLFALAKIKQFEDLAQYHLCYYSEALRIPR